MSYTLAERTRIPLPQLADDDLVIADTVAGGTGRDGNFIRLRAGITLAGFEASGNT